ncbi:MAG: hypothetical protein WBF50_03255 [Pseudolabrys sp.]
MTILNRPVAFAVCALALATVAVMEPALAKDPEPYNAADAARKYCSRAYKRYCANVPAGARLRERACEATAGRLPEGGTGSLSGEM